MTSPKSLIINSPYAEPRQHWQPQSDGSLARTDGRRPASYDIYDVRNNTRRVEVLEQVNEIRERVQAWRAADYPGTTTLTRELLAHWRVPAARQLPFYFCQNEAIETLIWWVEGAQAFRQGVNLIGDGGAWERLCSKMANGAGKTAVMAMIVTWQVLNALAHPKRNKTFSKTVFVVAPGITVKDRLRVLLPGDPANAFDEFSLCPSDALR